MARRAVPKSLPARHADRVVSVVGKDARARLDHPAGQVARSWQRCMREYGLTPTSTAKHERLAAAVLQRRRDNLGELLEIAQTEMENLFDQISGSGYAIVLTDPEGVITNFIADPAAEEDLAAAGIALGGVWDERHEGTNGMGTCLVERSPVTIRRGDHFLFSHTGLTCSAAPIFDPHGNLMAVLDASTMNPREANRTYLHTAALVNLSAQIIENNLFLRQFSDFWILRFHSRSEFVGLVTEGLLAVDENNRIQALNGGALEQLGRNSYAELIGTALDEVFDLNPPAPIDRAARTARSPWSVYETLFGHRYFARAQEPARARLVRSNLHSAQASGPANGDRPPRSRLGLNELEGSDPQVQYNARCVRRVLDKDINIMLFGETGTGKEAFASAIHRASRRADRPFVALNCASIPETLVESELFGYKRGAFTGARREGMRGKVLQANGGTLFLDEIGDMPLHLQPRLLRVLEEREVLPLGSEVPIPVDLHVICASHQDLGALVQGGQFREDLYFRLNGIILTLPPLRTRGDKRQLIQSILEEENDRSTAVVIDEYSLRALLDYDWPGNIRELRNSLRTALALCDGKTITRADLPAAVTGGQCATPAVPPPAAADPAVEFTSLDRAERDALLAELERNGWNVTTTAGRLRISRSTVYRKLRKFGIDPPG